MGRPPSSSSRLRRDSGISPTGAEEHHQHDDDAVDPELDLGDVEPEGCLVVEPATDVRQPLLVQPREDGAGEDDAPDASHPAEDDHAEQEDGDVEVELAGEGAALEARVEGAGDTAEEGADRVRPGLRAHERDAHRRGGGLVLADGDPGAAQARVAQAHRAEDRDQEQRERAPVEEVDLLERLLEVDGQAERVVQRRSEAGRVDRVDPEGAGREVEARRGRRRC